MKKKIKILPEFCLYIIAILITILGIFIVFELWNRDLSVPLSDTGDAIGAFSTAKNLLTNNSLTDYADLGAPYSMDNSASIQDYLLSAFIMWFVSRFATNAAATVNIYYLITYLLTSVSTLYVFRRIGIKRTISLLAAIIYSFAPYHFFRAISHIWLSSYYVLPLGLLGIYYILDGSLLDFDALKNQKKFSQKVLAFLRSNLLVSLLGVLFVGLSSIYYTVFLCICYLFAAFYAMMEYKKAKKMVEGIAMAVISAIPVIINQIKTAALAAEVFDVNIYTVREPLDLRAFSLRLMALILPIPCHRSEFFNSITQSYYDRISIYDETYMAALGTVTTIAFVVSMISGLTDSFIKNRQAVRFCKLNIFLVILGLTDGLNMFIGLFVSASIRCYNRLSIFIAFFSLLIMCFFLNDIKFKHIKTATVLGVLVMCFAIWDQTPRTLKFALDLDLNTFGPLGSYEENEKEYCSRYQLVESMERELEENAMVLMLPVGNETDPSSLYKTKAFICSNDLRFNYQWVGKNFFNEYIDNLPPEEQLEIAAICGFEAVMLDTDYYSKREYKVIANILEKNLGEAHTEKGTTWQWYDMREYAAVVCKKYSDEELASLREKYISSKNSFFVRYLANDKSICYTGKVKKNSKSVTLKNDAIQYGPYISLEPGKYNIMIRGDGLTAANVKCTCDSGKQEIIIEDINRSEHYIEYNIYLKENTENVEFVMSGADVILQYIEIVRVNNGIARYNADNLNLYYMGNVEESGEGMLLKNNAIQYGPYITLDSGKYHVIICGAGLDISQVSVTKESGNGKIEISNAVVSDTFLEYDIYLEKKTKEIEFTISGSDILLKSIEIYKDE